jgi:predicted DNA-binding protein
MGEKDNPAFSRSGLSSTLGAMTAEIPKIRLPEETKEILDREARKAGLNTSEFVRYLLMVRAHGVENMVSMEHQRLQIIAGIGNETGEVAP